MQEQTPVRRCPVASLLSRRSASAITALQGQPQDGRGWRTAAWGCATYFKPIFDPVSVKNARIIAPFPTTKGVCAAWARCLRHTDEYHACAHLASRRSGCRWMARPRRRNARAKPTISADTAPPRDIVRKSYNEPTNAAHQPHGQATLDGEQWRCPTAFSPPRPPRPAGRAAAARRVCCCSGHAEFWRGLPSSGVGRRAPIARRRAWQLRRRMSAPLDGSDRARWHPRVTVSRLYLFYYRNICQQRRWSSVCGPREAL